MEMSVKATQSMGKGLHKVFKTLVKDILQEFQYLVESGTEVSHFKSEPRKFTEVTKKPDDLKTLAKYKNEGN